MAMLELTNICKKYGEFYLGPIDLQLQPGTVHGLIGANGAGKTTLFRCIMGTVRKDQGLMKVNGSSVDGRSGEWKKLVGYIGDYAPFFDLLSGAKNLKIQSAYYDNWSDETVQNLASRFELNLSQTVKNYSTGQRTKLALILALAHDPKLLLLDEPTTGLDPVARDVFMEVIYERMQDEEFTVLYATHHVSEIEHLADQLILINSGRILRHEITEDIVQNWRKITFKTESDIGPIPNQISKIKHRNEFEVISNNFQSSLWFLQQAGVESIQTTQLSMEKICVQILKNQLMR